MTDTSAPFPQNTVTRMTKAFYMMGENSGDFAQKILYDFMSFDRKNSSYGSAGLPSVLCAGAQTIAPVLCGVVFMDVTRKAGIMLRRESLRMEQGHPPDPNYDERARALYTPKLNALREVWAEMQVDSSLRGLGLWALWEKYLREWDTESYQDRHSPQPKYKAPFFSNTSKHGMRALLVLAHMFEVHEDELDAVAEHVLDPERIMFEGAIPLAQLDDFDPDSEID